MDHQAPSNPRARAHICYGDRHTRIETGKRLPHLNPAYEVKGQNAPTAEHPVSQHKQFKGHKGGGSGLGGHIPTPHLKGTK